jgi:hypothetical protein
MTVRLVDNATVALEGVCPIDDAERLLQHLVDYPDATVDWRECDDAHTAVVQVLIMSRAKVMGPPRNNFLTMFVNPLIEDERSGRGSPSGA